MRIEVELRKIQANRPDLGVLVPPAGYAPVGAGAHAHASEDGDGSDGAAAAAQRGGKDRGKAGQLGLGGGRMLELVDHNNSAR